MLKIKALLYPGVDIDLDDEYAIVKVQDDRIYISPVNTPQQEYKISQMYGEWVIKSVVSQPGSPGTPGTDQPYQDLWETPRVYELAYILLDRLNQAGVGTDYIENYKHVCEDIVNEKWSYVSISDIVDVTGENISCLEGDRCWYKENLVEPNDLDGFYLLNVHGHEDMYCNACYARGAHSEKVSAVVADVLKCAQTVILADRNFAYLDD